MLLPDNGPHETRAQWRGRVNHISLTLYTSQKQNSTPQFSLMEDQSVGYFYINNALPSQ